MAVSITQENFEKEADEHLPCACIVSEFLKHFIGEFIEQMVWICVALFVQKRKEKR